MMGFSQKLRWKSMGFSFGNDPNMVLFCLCICMYIYIYISYTVMSSED